MLEEEFPEPATVYGLLSSRDDRFRYIGQTTGLPNMRFNRHMSGARHGKTGAVNDWIREETAAGFNVEMRILDEAGTLNETECEFIAILRAAGYDLLNKFAGGGTSVQADRTVCVLPEARRKMSAAAKGRRQTEATKKKIGKAVSAFHREEALMSGVPATASGAASLGMVVSALTATSR